MKFLPKSYQEPAIDFICGTPRCALHAGIGSGKTVIALTAIDQLWKSLDINRVLILAPLNVILNTFPDEIDKWEHTRDLSFTTLHGPEKDERLQSDAEIHLLNFEGLKWFAGSSKRQFYDMIIIDESHMIKDFRSQRFKIARAIFKDTPRIVEMTGTPIGNSLMDLWSQYYLLDHGTRLFRTQSAFQGTYFRQADYMGYKWEPYDWAEAAIIKKVSDITFQVHPDDVELTELTEREIKCPTPDKYLDQYKEFEREYFIQIDEAEIEAFNAVTLSTKLRQFANGFMYHGDPNAHVREVKVVHRLKFEMLKEYMRDISENVMIVSTFMEDFEALKEQFPGIAIINGRTKKPRSRKIIKAWNDGQIKIMAIHPRSVGTGLNLQDGGCRQIWTSPDWSYLAKNQTVGRVHRTGQKEDVLIEVMVAEGTIDEMILEALKEKTVTTESFSKKLRLYRKSKIGETT